MNSSDRESIAAKKLMNAMFRLQSTRLVANIICTLSTVGSVVAPFALATTTGDWSNLLLLLIYPFTLLPATITKNLTKSPDKAEAAGGLGYILFYKLMNPPLWYLLIGIGLLASYYVLVSVLPKLQAEVDHAYLNPDLERLRQEAGR